MLKFPAIAILSVLLFIAGIFATLVSVAAFSFLVLTILATVLTILLVALPPFALLLAILKLVE
jgi:hypothetical protein